MQVALIGNGPAEYRMPGPGRFSLTDHGYQPDSRHDNNKQASQLQRVRLLGHSNVDKLQTSPNRYEAAQVHTLSLKVVSAVVPYYYLLTSNNRKGQ